MPFHRTPKLAAGAPVLQALVFVYQEILLALLLVGGAYGTLLVFGTMNDDAVLWGLSLLTQALPYFAAIVASLLSSVPTEKTP